MSGGTLDSDTLQLLRHLHRGGAWSYWWTLPEKGSAWWPAGKPSTPPASAKGVYFGVNPAVAKRGPAERSRNVDIAALNCVYADVDAKDFDGDKKTAAEHVRGLATQPSAIVDSGGGYHCYWLLAEPFCIASEDDRERARRLQAGWVALVHGDDGAKDLAHVLRLPGTRNSKYSPPRPVRIMRADFSRLYGFAELEALLPVIVPKQANVPTPSPNGHQVDEAERGRRYALAALTRECDTLARMAPATGRNNQVNRAAFNVGGFVASGLLERGEVEQGVYAAACACGLDRDPGCGQRGIESSIKSGLEAGMTRLRYPPVQDPAPASAPKPATPEEPPQWMDGEPDILPPVKPAEGQARSLAGEHLTDLGNARRLVAQHGQELRYCHPWKEWLCWDGQRWAIDVTGEAERRVKDTIRAMYAEASTIEDDKQRQMLANHAMRSEATAKIQAMLKSAESEPGIPVLPPEMDSDPWLLNVLNGTLDLRDGRLREHRRQDLLTKVAPVFYAPDATCPQWLTFLDRIMGGSQALKTYLQRIIGYSLTGDTSEQTLFIAYGSGANGKSTLVETVQAMMGEDYAVRIRTETLMAKQGDVVPTDIARLRGARLASAQETEDGKRLAESLIKQLTGGDTITARFLYQREFQFRPTFKLFLAANHKPAIHGTDYAIWRRVKLIPFTVTIPEAEQDKQLSRKLQAELDGILTWAVRGCLDWQREGLATPGAVKAATEAYRAESDVMAAFLSECTVQSPMGEVQAGQLYQAYTKWCEANGEHAITGQKFARRIAERGFDKYRKGAPVYYIGLALAE